MPSPVSSSPQQDSGVRFDVPPPLIVFFIAAALLVSSCRREQAPVPVTGSFWRPQARTARLIRPAEKGNILERIIYLNAIYDRFDSLTVRRDVNLNLFVLDLASLRILRGTRRDKDRTELEGEEIAFAARPDEGLFQANSLGVLKIELTSSRAVRIRMAISPALPGEPGYGTPAFIQESDLPECGTAAPVFVDLARRFGPEERPAGWLIISVTARDGGKVRVGIQEIAAMSSWARLCESIPAQAPLEIVGDERRQLQSVFLPAGSRASYTIDLPAPGPLVIECAVAGVGAGSPTVDIQADGQSLIRQTLGGAVRHVRKEFAASGRRLTLTLTVEGGEGSAAAIGNLSLHAPVTDKKNVVLYLVDALRADQGGVEGTAFETRFAEGAVFIRAYANATRTADSLPSLFSAKYKFTLVDRDEEVPFVGNRNLLLAEYLKSRGYTTAAFLTNPWLEMSNASRGFDEVFFCNDPLAKGSLIPSPEEYESVKRGRLAALLENWVRENIDKPLFVFIHTIEPHNPYETPLTGRVDSRAAPVETLALIRRDFSEPRPYPVLENPDAATLGTLKSLYRDAVRAAADYFADTEALLVRNGLLDPSSLFILTADHGERLYEHRTWIHGPPDVYEEVLRVPLMLRGPGVPAGVFTEPAQLLDIYPTIVDWLGDPPEPSQPGTSLLKVISGEETSGDGWHRVIYVDGTGPLQYACIWGDVKVIIAGTGVEVYDLKNDRLETRNLAGDKKYQKYIAGAKAFRDRFPRNAGKATRRVRAEERERLRSLGYLN